MFSNVMIIGSSYHFHQSHNHHSLTKTENKNETFLTRWTYHHTVGHARTFWIAYQRALKKKGSLVLRVEDLVS